MNKFFISFIYFGIALSLSCSNAKVDQVKSNVTTLQNDSVGSQTIIPTGTDYKTTFGANVVTEIGKAINCIFQDKNNNYWFASNAEGVYCYEGKSLTQFTTKDGLTDNQVFTIQEDKQGNIWFVTVGGISRFDGKTFTTFPTKNNEPLVSEKNLNMETDELWFEVGGGAYRYDGNSFSYFLLPAPDLNTKYYNSTNPQNPDARKINAYSVYCSMKDKSGNIWFGTQTMGVFRYDGKSFTWFTESGLAGPAVRALFEDSKGNFWFGNNGNGLFQYDGKNLSNFTEEKGLGNPEFLRTGKSRQGTLARVWTVNEDNDGNIWIGTCDAGVWRYDGQKLKNYTTKDGLTSNAINTIYKDKKGELWFGTDGAGVCKFNGISFSTFTIAPLQE